MPEKPHHFKYLKYSKYSKYFKYFKYFEYFEYFELLGIFRKGGSLMFTISFQGSKLSG